MVRSVIGFALFAIVAWIALRIVFSLLGGLIGLALTVLWLAAIGFVLYLGLRLVSPRTADRLRDAIRGGGGSAGV